jgi:hypothetical protein
LCGFSDYLYALIIKKIVDNLVKNILREKRYPPSASASLVGVLNLVFLRKLKKMEK